MSGAYQEIPLGRDYAFTTNVSTRLTELGATMVNATFYFLSKADPSLDEDADAVINVTPTANTTTNVVTITIPRANTNPGYPVPQMFWEVSMLTASNLYYTLDQGRMALVEPVRLTVP